MRCEYWKPGNRQIFLNNLWGTWRVASKLQWLSGKKKSHLHQLCPWLIFQERYHPPQPPQPHPQQLRSIERVRKSKERYHPTPIPQPHLISCVGSNMCADRHTHISRHIHRNTDTDTPIRRQAHTHTETYTDNRTYMSACMHIGRQTHIRTDLYKQTYRHTWKLGRDLYSLNTLFTQSSQKRFSLYRLDANEKIGAVEIEFLRFLEDELSK